MTEIWSIQSRKKSNDCKQYKKNTNSKLAHNFLFIYIQPEINKTFDVLEALLFEKKTHHMAAIVFLSLQPCTIIHILDQRFVVSLFFVSKKHPMSSKSPRFGRSIAISKNINDKSRLIVHLFNINNKSCFRLEIANHWQEKSDSEQHLVRKAIQEYT
jgi:hypothetical protein